MTTSASTEPTILNREDVGLCSVRAWRLSEAAIPEIMEENRHRKPNIEVFSSGVPGMGVFAPEVLQRLVLHVFIGDTVDHEIKFFQYGEDSGSVIVTDFGEPTSEFPEEQQEVIDRLRSNGRPILSEKLVTMLRDVQEDPDSPQVNIVSLRQMASLFIEQRDSADPFIGPDSRGFVYAQWRIIGNGVLIIRFPDDEKILLVAQADKTSDREELDISVQGPKSKVLEEYGYLVPLRH